MDNVTIQLSKPLQVGEELLTELVIRPLTAGILRKLKGDPSKDIFDMACQFLTHAADIPPSAVNQMSGADMIGKVLPVFTDFLGASPETGESSAAS